MTKPPIDYMELVHSPLDLANAHVKWAESLQDAPGVPFGIPIVDKKVIPMHPGDMVVFCARPGHGKSSILSFLARAEAKRIIARGAEKTECVVYVTWEQVTEELNAVLQTPKGYTVSDVVWGRVDMEMVKEQAVKRVNLPVWLIGESLTRTNGRSPRMYPETVFQAIEAMVAEYDVKPTLLLVDYIQLIPIPSQSDRQKQVIEAAHRVKELAKRVGCPAAVAVQAGRNVDQRDSKIPTLQDAQWSSSIEQAADKFFSLWRPWLTEDHFDAYGQPARIVIDSEHYDITEKLLVMAMRKQRFDNGRWTWALKFQPEYLKICALESDVERIPL